MREKEKTEKRKVVVLRLIGSQSQERQRHSVSDYYYRELFTTGIMALLSLYLMSSAINVNIGN